MGCYYTLYHNTYAFSLLFYKVYMKRENAGSWNSGLEKEQILETYSAQLQKSWNFTEIIFGIYKKYWAKKAPEGGHQPATRVEGAPYPLGTPPDLVGPMWPLPLIPAPIHSFFLQKKSLHSSNSCSCSSCCHFRCPCSKLLLQNCFGGLFFGMWLLQWSN